MATDATPEKSWPSWARPFLENFREHRSVAAACRAVQKNKTTVYRLRDQSISFAAEWDEIFRTVLTDLEESAMTRAVMGGTTTVEERDAQGNMVQVRKTRAPETSLTIFMLKVHGDKKYRFDGAALEQSAASFARAIHECVRGARESVPDPEMPEDNGGE